MQLIGVILMAWMLVACGGGGGGGSSSSSAALTPSLSPSGSLTPPDITINGTAAVGRAIALAGVSAKCQTGTGTAQTEADGTYRMSVANGVLPCVLEIIDPADNAKLHTLATGTGLSTMANITPLTEMLAARVLGKEPASVFANFDAVGLANLVTPARLQSAQSEVGAALSGTVDTLAIPDLISTPLTAATAVNATGGDAQDKLLDVLKVKLNATQISEVVTALAVTPSTTVVRKIVSDRVAANQSRLTSTVNLTSKTVLLSWTDSFAAGTNYRVESQNTNGSFSTVEIISGVGGGGTVMQWQRAITVSAVYRVVAVLADSTVTIATPQGQSWVSVNIDSNLPTIVIDVAEPVSGLVKLSLGNTAAYLTVAWYSDLRLIGTVASGAGPMSWSTATETNGSHLVLAKVQVATDAYMEVRRSIAVSNSNIAVNASVAGTTGIINVDVSASSQFGIARIEATFDANTAGSLTAPNACSYRLGCSGRDNIFRFNINAATAGSGNHTMVITATDTAGNRKTTTVQVPVSNLPALAVASPVDGAFVNGTLRLSGLATTDKTGPVTVRASLGDYPFMNTTSAAFEGTMDLTGLNPGSYTLTVRATDSTQAVTVVQRTVTVTSHVATTYSPVLLLGTTGRLLAAQGNQILYSAEDSSVRLRNVLSKTETVLTNAGNLSDASDWQISNGSVYVFGKDAGCVLYCVYQWAVDGSLTNLSNPNPYSAAPNIGGGRAYDLHPVAHDGYVIWVNDKANVMATSGGTGWYTLYEVATGTYTKIAPPAGVNYVGNWNYDFAVKNGVVTFVYWAQTGGEGATSSFDVFKWTSTTQTSTRLSGGVARNIYPQFDGLSIAWLQTATNASGLNTLLSMPLTGGSVAPVSSTASENFVLRDGVLSWVETTATTKALKTSVQGTIRTISTMTSSILYGAGGGVVVFGEAGKTYSWNALTKTATLRIDTAPNQVMISGGLMYFIMGATQAVYQMGLN